MKLETERIVIKALTAEELENFIQAIELKANYEDIVVSDNLKNKDAAYLLKEVLLKKVYQKPTMYCYNTFWLIYDKENKKQLGQYCFNAPPNAEGLAEIYFEIYQDDQNKGYMTEALIKILEWCKGTGKIKKVKTIIENFNVAAEKLLKNMGFEKEPETNYMSRWIKTI